MASQIPFTELTLNPKEAANSNEMVFESVFVNPSTLSEVHDIQTGVDMDRFIPIVGGYGPVGKLDAGGCSSNTETGVIATSEKKWEPKLISFRLPHCQADLPDLLKVWGKSMKAAGTWDEIDNEMLAFVESKAMEATFESILRYASFGDKTATNVGAGTGSELITAGKDATYLTAINGLWAQIFADDAGDKKIFRSTITENGLTTKSAQLALGDDVALVAFREMYDGIAPEAFEGGNLVLQCTRNMHANWVKFIENKSLAFMLDRAEQGATKWTYRGVPIMIRYDWDRGINYWHDLGTTLYLPTRAVLSRLSNIPVGTSDEESMKELRSFYDFKDKMWYLDVAYKIDMKILQEEMMAAAY